MKILVPDTSPPPPHHVGTAGAFGRGIGVAGFLGALLLFSMVFTEGEVHFPYLRYLLMLMTGSFGGFLLSWRRPRFGGAIQALCMITAVVVTPVKLLEWRPYFYLAEGLLILAGLLLLFHPRPNPEA